MKKDRIPIIDLLKIIAMLAVIAIHTTSRTLEQGGFDILRIPNTLIINQLARFAVPFFFLLSGFSLEHSYPHNIQPMIFYKKRLRTILIPYVLWNIVYYIFFYENSVNSLFTINFLQGLFIGNVSIQMYFIPALCLLYLLFPFIHASYSRIIRNPWVIACSLFWTFLWFYDYYFSLEFIPTPIRIALLNIYIFTFGMALSHYRSNIRSFVSSRKVIITTLCIFAGFCIWYEGHDMFLWNHRINIVTSQWRFSVVVYTLCIFGLLFTSLEKVALRFHKPIELLASLTFYIYFSHIFFISIFWKLWGSYLFSNSTGHVIEAWWFEPIVFLFVTISSFTTGLLLKKTGKAQHLLGL